MREKAESVTKVDYVLQVYIDGGWTDCDSYDSLHIAKEFKSNFQAAFRGNIYCIILRTTTEKLIES